MWVPKSNLRRLICLQDQLKPQTRGTLRAISISPLAKIPTLYRNPRIRKRYNYLSCIEGKGGLKDIHCIAQNAMLFLDLL